MQYDTWDRVYKKAEYKVPLCAASHVIKPERETLWQISLITTKTMTRSRNTRNSAFYAADRRARQGR